MILSIYNSHDQLVGKVSGEEIYDSRDRLIGSIHGRDIYDSHDRWVATMHGDRILDTESNTLGRVSGSDIYEGPLEDWIVGRVSPEPRSEESLNAAGGAAELLLFARRGWWRS